MDLNEAVDALQSTVVMIKHPRPDRYPTPGVLVQGLTSPLILSALHCFVGLTVGEILHAILQVPEEAIDVQIFICDDRHDFIAFRVLSSISHRRTAQIDFDPACTAVGKAYLMFGYSSCTHVDSQGIWHLAWRVTPGMFATGLSKEMRIGMSGGCIPGDSGGPVFSPFTRGLLGVNVLVSNIPPYVHDVNAARMRVSPEGNMVPLWFLSRLLPSLFLPEGGPTQTTNISNINHQTLHIIQPVPVPANVALCAAAENDSSLDWIASMDEALRPED